MARAYGALEIVATDIAPFTLETAAKIGADTTINVATQPDGLAAYATGKGRIDVLFECSGAAPALAGAIPAMRPGGTIVQLGLGGDMTLPVQAMTAKELSLKGSFRFHHEFPLAVEMMQAGRISVDDLITHTFPVSGAIEAFETATDRSKSLKVQLEFA